MWFIGVEVEQETSAAPPKKNPGSAPATAVAKNCPYAYVRNSHGQAGLNVPTFYLYKLPVFSTS